MAVRDLQAEKGLVGVGERGFAVADAVDAVAAVLCGARVASGWRIERRLTDGRVDKSYWWKGREGSALVRGRPC